MIDTQIKKISIQFVKEVFQKCQYLPENNRWLAQEFSRIAMCLGVSCQATDIAADPIMAIMKFDRVDNDVVACSLMLDLWKENDLLDDVWYETQKSQLKEIRMLVRNRIMLISSKHSSSNNDAFLEETIVN